MIACDPALAALTGEAEDSPVVAQVADVDGVPMSALLAETADPRAIIVAWHGGASNASYFDCPNHPRSSLLRTAAALGFTTLALDRPGYGASHPHANTMTAAKQRVDLAYAAIDAHLGSRPRGAGVFIMAHSAGCELALRMAADQRGKHLLGVELAGTGRHYHPAVLALADAKKRGTNRRSRPQGLGRLLWQPPHMYPGDAVRGAVTGSPSPAYESTTVTTWTTDFSELAARVRVPVQYSLGEHEMIWQSGPEGLADIAALFTASPRVAVNEQTDSGHNLSVGLGAMAYHLKVVSFVEECVLARENTR